MNSNFDADIRRLKSIIERYDRNTLITLLINNLGHLDNCITDGDFEQLKPLQPWSLLFILEICFIYGQTNKIKIHQNTLAELVNTFHDISNISFFTDDNPRLFRMKTIRTVAFQQFYFQNKMNTIRIGKEIWLFRNSPQVIKDQFKQIAGYSLEYYYVNYFFFMMWIMGLADPSENVITWLDWVKTMSLTYEQVKDYLRRTIKRRHSADETERALSLQQTAPPFFDVIWQSEDLLYRSFFFDFPILQHPQEHMKFITPSKLLLQESLLKRPYRMLKEKFGRNFSGIFGLEVFERYLEAGLSATNKCFYTEYDLKVAGYKKKVDFVIVENEAFILVEAKAIEMTPYRQINFSQQLLEEGFKTTVIKGYTQIHYVANRLKILFPDIPIYSLIVTYEELFLGHGELIWYEWMREAWQKKELNPQFYNEEFAINPNRVFVISADCYDYLLQLESSISSVLEEAISEAEGDGWMFLDQRLKGKKMRVSLN